MSGQSEEEEGSSKLGRKTGIRKGSEAKRVNEVELIGVANAQVGDGLARLLSHVFGAHLPLQSGEWLLLRTQSGRCLPLRAAVPAMGARDGPQATQLRGKVHLPAAALLSLEARAGQPLTVSRVDPKGISSPAHVYRAVHSVVLEAVPSEEDVDAEPESASPLSGWTRGSIYDHYVRIQWRNRLFSPHQILVIALHGRFVRLRFVRVLLRDGVTDLSSTAADVTDPRPPLFWLSEETDVHLQAHAPPHAPLARPSSAPLPIALGGVDEVWTSLQAAYTWAMAPSRPSVGVLLHGPPGTGKTQLARSLAEAHGAALHVVHGADVVSAVVGASERALAAVFAKALETSPSVLFLDEVDALAPASGGGASARLTAALLEQVDALLRSPSRVLLVAATNRLDQVALSLRRSGRLDEHLAVGVPTAAERGAILWAQLRAVHHALNFSQCCTLARELHGFVGADIAALVREAVFCSLRRQRSNDTSEEKKQLYTKKKEEEEEEKISNENTTKEEEIIILIENSPKEEETLRNTSYEKEECDEEITLKDLEMARLRVRPSALREVEVDVPTVRWDQVGGQESAKRALQEAVEWPIRHAEAFAKLGIRPSRGVLLYGPPGCSKTLLAKALATEAGLNFLAVKGPELFSKWVGESEKAVRRVFERARAVSPAILFFDEMDALAAARQKEAGSSVQDRVVTQLLLEMDGLLPLARVVVVGATNRPELMDPALLRPGRFDRLVYVAPPSEPDRLAILHILCADMPVALDPDQWLALARDSADYSGAELAAVCREAALTALRENGLACSVSYSHFVAALRTIPPRLTPDMLLPYLSFAQAHS